MANLLDAAQMLMDLYYQDYKTDENFFSMVHFKYLVGVAYSKLLEDEYKEARTRAMQETGVSEIVLQSDWLMRLDLEAKKELQDGNDYLVQLPSRVFSFPYDQYSYGVQSIDGKEGNCRDFARTSSRSRWKICQTPRLNKVFWFVEHTTIRLLNVYCTPTKVSVAFIPDVTESSSNDAEIPTSKVLPIIERAIDIMRKARDGTVVDMTNNSNPNKTIQTEVDTTFSNLKTKPI